MAKYNIEQFDSGKALQNARDKMGYSQGELAIQLGEKTKTVMNYEGRNSNVGIKTYMEWCDKLGCDIDFLLGVQDTRRKDADDICSSTGLDEATIDLMKKEFYRPQSSPVIVVNKKDASKEWKVVPDGAKGVSSGVATADLINALCGQDLNCVIGDHFRRTMLQYITESVVFNLLKEKVDDVVRHHNEQSGRQDGSGSWIDYAEAIYTSIRQITSLSSLTMTGKVQSGIADDFTNFRDAFNSVGFSEADVRVFFDYIQSKNRLKALEQSCRGEVVQFLDGMSVGRQLTYYDSFMGVYDVTSGADSESGKTQHPKDSKKVIQLKAEIKELKSINSKLIVTNNELSAELSEARWKIKSLEEKLDRLKSDSTDK